ncbi:3-hydroxyacyl-CoA dehydrogenase NAD-binding domain-containing protein [Pseudoxanthobacter sp.]|uniref:3-hydroxyacyl-CoA dehydrogenase/enoyl-CoA hydratase family protein n=1 Tax=Pseudoxanthobacter sp. TaxID=1925742 RepID=UPI002FDF4A77
MSEIRKVAVIGAGVMGAGIAAHVANAGIPVLLLDIVPPGAGNRNIVAGTAVEKLKTADPAPFMSPKAARLVETGNIEDDLGRLAEADWIIEAVVERLDVKQALYARIDAVRRPGTAVSSNTSTIALEKLTAGLPDGFRRDFLVTHFFNPPRYMRLMELVTGPETDTALAGRIAGFADRVLGKSVVRCKDRPGFIANRLGVAWIQRAIVEAIDLGLSVEEADAVMGRPFGIPKTGVFGLVDLVGLDLMPHISASLKAALPPGDAFHASNRDLPLIRRMIAEGYTGRKGKGGFYRLNRAGGGKVKEAVDLATGEYRASVKPEIEGLARGDLRALLSREDRIGRYAFRVMAETLTYAASLVGEASDDILAIDEAMRLGYNWKWGPFELIDRIGGAWFAARLTAAGFTLPPLLAGLGDRTFYRIADGRRQALSPAGTYADIVRPEGVLWLEDIKLAAQPVLKNGSASLWEIGDGVVCFEFTSKGNSMDADIMALLGRTIDLVEKKYRALVIYNEGPNFSVGANLGLALFAANIAAWGEIEKLVEAGQQTYKRLKYAPFPVVAAPSGMALGGGCEILLHADAVQAHAESYIGLVECGVGLIPAWGGCKEMLGRWQSAGKLPKGPMPAPARVFETLSVATVAKSAAEARDLLFLRPTDGITMNRYRLLADAKARALALAENYTPPKPFEVVLPGPAGKVAMTMAAEGFARRGIATKHDLVVAGELATVLSGGPADIIDTLGEDRILELEQEGFMRLVRTNATLARFESVLETGKPVRN